MSTCQSTQEARKAELEEECDPPLLRLAEHAIGLWQAARDVGDDVLLEALRPLVIQIARSLARDLMQSVGDETAH